MTNNELVPNEQMLARPVALEARSVDIPDAPPVRLQTLDLARHTAIEPGGKRYVVATFNDAQMKRGIVTAVYPQQNGYLTLVRLTVCEFSSEDVDQAVQRHITLVQKIQQGKLKDYLKANQK